MAKNEYEEFFNKIGILKEEQEKQKKRGLNDYNLLTTVLKPHDEVRLHSRMIGSLLDIKGKHYQGELFLELFLEILGIKDYNLKNSEIHLEYENIDLYLTDEVNHIIIENKIWAGDQKSQIKRYIDIVRNENENLEIENLYVIYLSINRLVPSPYSLGNLKIINNFIYDGNEKIAQYRPVHYKTDIINWLEQCEYEVQNITNLNEAIKQYQGVVKMVNGDYKSKVKNMEEVILKDEKSLEIASDIFSNYETIRKNIIKNFFTKTLIEKFQEKLDNSDEYKGWKIKVDEDIITKARSYPIQIFKYENWKIVFAFSFGVKNMNRGYWTVVNISKKNNLDNLRNKYTPLDKIPNKTSKSILWADTDFKYSYSKDSMVKFQFDKEKTVERYYKYFTEAMNTLNKLNLPLETLNNDLI